MDQNKVGNFIKELRKEQSLTQEQLAEHFNVARRTVSRWENGNNLPDLDILIEMSDLFGVDLREILDGERKSEKMDAEMKETVMKVAEYSNEGKKKLAKVTLVYFVVGIVSIIVNIGMRFLDLPSTFWVGFLDGTTSGLPLAAMLLGVLYVTGTMVKLQELKLKILGRNDEH
ncbi:MAG: helix-turn-helix domain-containing protein [Clostridiales bacterium]|jgi:transcriptional regulator with XRE-family HTH domain|nr:helix-turn-helix domain-containing protein [Clostridiales bacterium]